jgi:hypothetical protein
MTNRESHLAGVMLNAINPNKLSIDQLGLTLNSQSQEYNRLCSWLTLKFKKLDDQLDCYSNNILADCLVPAWSAPEYCEMFTTISESIKNRCLYLLDGRKTRKFSIDIGAYRNAFRIKDGGQKYQLASLGYKSVKHVLDVHYHRHQNHGDLIQEYVTALTNEYPQIPSAISNHCRCLIGQLSIDLVYLLRQSFVILKEIDCY